MSDDLTGPLGGGADGDDAPIVVRRARPAAGKPGSLGARLADAPPTAAAATGTEAGPAEASNRVPDRNGARSRRTLPPPTVDELLGRRADAPARAPATKPPRIAEAAQPAQNAQPADAAIPPPSGARGERNGSVAAPVVPADPAPARPDRPRDVPVPVMGARPAFDEERANALAELDRRRRIGSALLLGSFVFLWPLTVLTSRGRIERELTRRVTRQFEVAGVQGIDVALDGRDVSLAGTVRTRADIDTLRSLAKSRKGVRVVNTSGLVVDGAAAPIAGGAAPTTTTPAALGRPTKVTAQIAGARITIASTVSNEATKDALLEEVRKNVPADALVDEVRIDPAEGESNLDAHRQVGVFLGQMLARGIDDANVDFDNGSLLLRATVPDPLDGNSLRADALTLVGEPAKLSATIAVDATASSAPGDPSTTVPSVVTPELVQAADAAIQANLAGKVITFEKESATLDAGGIAVIDSLAEAIKSIPSTGLRFRVAGHTDSKGSVGGNQRLSERRASAVKDRLVVDGIAVDRIDAVGFGESQPVADNGTEEGRAQNRRIEITVIVPDGLEITTTTSTTPTVDGTTTTVA